MFGDVCSKVRVVPWLTLFIFIINTLYEWMFLSLDNKSANVNLFIPTNVTGQLRQLIFLALLLSKFQFRPYYHILTILKRDMCPSNHIILHISVTFNFAMTATFQEELLLDALTSLKNPLRPMYWVNKSTFVFTIFYLKSKMIGAVK